MKNARFSPGSALAILWISLACLAAGQAGPYDAWTRAMDITMNTTASGANILSTLEGYPLAVRLTGDNFDFSQARPGGQDIRFTGAGGTALSYEIEMWNRDGQEALVWVKTTVHGNNDTQKIVMYWGKEDAESESSPQGVFSADQDWVGVFHLNEQANNDTANFRDATPNAVHATGTNMMSADAEEGVLGGAIRFVNNRSNAIKVSGPERNIFAIPSGDWSISVWATKDGISNVEYQTMMCMGDDHWNLQRWGSRHVFESCAKITVSPGHMCTMGGSPFEDVSDTWFHLTASFKRNEFITVYLNGEFYDRANYAPGKWNLTSVHPFAIGTQSQQSGRTWSGRIDEARVTNRMLTQDWVRLDYLSQQPGSTFLSFGEGITSAVRRSAQPPTSSEIGTEGLTYGIDGARLSPGSRPAGPFILTGSSSR